MNNVSLTCYLNTVTARGILELDLSWTDTDKPADKDIQTVSIRTPYLPDVKPDLTAALSITAGLHAILGPARNAGFRSIRLLTYGMVLPDNALPLEIQSNDMKVHIEAYDLANDKVGTLTHALYMAAYREQCNARQSRGRQILTLDPKYTKR